jgi:hypothetical protein
MPVPTPNYPLHKVEMSFVDNPLGADPYDYSGSSPVGGWIDVTADVRSASVDRGRNNDLEKVDAGTATIVLDNRTRKYDPLNQSSVYWDSTAGATLLKPRRQVKISGVYPNDCTVNNYCYDLVSGNTWSPYVANNFTTRGLDLATAPTNFTYTGASSDYFSLSVHVQPVATTWFSFFASLGSQQGNGLIAINLGTLFVFRSDGGGLYTSIGSVPLSSIPWIEDDNKPLWFKLEVSGISAGAGTYRLYVAPTAFAEPDADWQLVTTIASTSISGDSTTGTFSAVGVSGDTLNLKRAIGKRENVSNVIIKEFDLLVDTHINIFNGYTQGFPQNFTTYGEDATVNLECFDLMGLLGNMTTPLDAAEEIFLPLNPWGFWRLGDAGDLAVDSSGNQHDLLHRNKAVQPFNLEPLANGVSGVGTFYSAYDVDIRPRTSSGNLAPVRTDSSATIMCWVRFDRPFTASGQETIIKMGATRDSEDSFLISQYFSINLSNINVNAIRALVWDNTSNFYFVDTTSVDKDFADGAPHHVVLTLDNSGATGVAKLYVDGILYETRTLTATRKARHGGYIAIGGKDVDGAIATAGQSQGTLKGIISDVVYLDTVALTQTQITNIYNAYTGLSAVNTSERLTEISDYAGIPSRLQLFDYNTVGECGSFDYTEDDAVLALMQKVEDTEQGILYADREGRLTLLGRYYLSTQDAGIRVNALFSDDSTDAGRIRFRNLRFSFDGDQLVNNHVIIDGDDAKFDYEDSTSVTEYGRRTRTIETLLQDTESARQMSIGLTNIYKNPLIKAEEFEIVPLQNDWFNVLPLDIGYRTELRVTPMNTGAEIDQELALQRIRYDIAPKEWNVFVSASPRPVVSYFILSGYENEVERVNYALNPSFENGLTTGWNVLSHTLTAPTDANALFGTRVLRASSTSGLTSIYVASPLFIISNALAGERFAVSMYIRTSTTRNVEMSTEFRTSAGTLLGTVTQTVSIPANTWTRLTNLSGTYASPIGTVQTLFYTQRSNSTSGLVTLFDGHLIEKTISTLPYFDGGYSAQYRDYDVVTTSWIGDQYTSISKATYARSADYIQGSVLDGPDVLGF